MPEWTGADFLSAIGVVVVIAGLIGGAIGGYSRARIKALEARLEFDQKQWDRDRDRMQSQIAELQGQVQLLRGSWLRDELRPAVVAAVKEAINGNGRSS